MFDCWEKCAGCYKTSNNYINTYRLKVPGGWLYTTDHYHLTFVPSYVPTFSQRHIDRYGDL